MDVRSLPWFEVREVVLSAVESCPDLQPWVNTLRTWDGRMTSESRAAALFAVFAARMMVRVARVKAPRSHPWFLGRTAWNLGINVFYLKRMQPLIELLRTQPPGWFPTPWSEVIAQELRQAVRSCHGRSWGQLHRLRPKSMVLGDRPFFRRAFSLGPVPIGGDTDTIHQASVRPEQPIGETDNVAGLRMVVDVGNWSDSRFALCGGQSGNPCSPHYGDLFEYWRRGEGVPMAWTPEEVRSACVAELRLQPEAAVGLHASIPTEPTQS